MLLRHLKGTDRMAPLENTYSLRLAREIIGLKLQPPNKEGRRWWKLNPDKLEQRLKSAGLDPVTLELLQSDLWEFAIQQALDTLAERKVKNRLYKENRRKLVRAAVATANGHTISPITSRRTELVRVPVDYEGFGTVEKAEIPNPEEIGEVIRRQPNGELDSFGGTNARQPAGWSESLRVLGALDEQRLACKYGQPIKPLPPDEQERPDRLY